MNMQISIRMYVIFACRTHKRFALPSNLLSPSAPEPLWHRTALPVLMDSTSAAFNLVIAAIGCGVLSFPFGFASAGLALGIAFALCFAAVNVWTLDILATACLAYTENAPYRTMVTSAPKKSSRSLNRNLTTSSIAGSMPTLVVAVGGAPPVTVSYEILSTFCTCRFIFSRSMYTCT